MAWSLVEALAEPAPKRRPFYLPLASVPPNATTVRAVDPDQFAFADSTTDPDDPYLRIDIAPIGGNEGTLPDPAIRLHAMAAGLLRFAPSSGIGQSDSLVLRMCKFTEPLAVPWWDRWVISGHVPLELTYENVDKAQLQAMLALPSDPKILGAPGLSLPADVTDKSVFLPKFFTGDAGYELTAEAGAVIGLAGSHPDPAKPTARQLRLHVNYNTHTATAPRPMTPREFFYLLFGNDSAEFTAANPPATPSATGHPLLLRMHELGLSDPASLRTKTMRMRPPLHTSKRVWWEAQQEIETAPTNWKSDELALLGPARLFNTHVRDGASFERATYGGWDKCNIFINDICLRAGFRAVIHLLAGNTAWHYIDANSSCNLGRKGHATKDRQPLLGRVEDKKQRWGWNVDGWIAASTDRQALLNDALDREGRCLIVAIGRGRQFRARKITPTVKGIDDCANCLRTVSGHIVFVKHVVDQPTVNAGVVTKIKVECLQAGGGSGASTATFTLSVGGTLGGTGGAGPFVFVQVIELEAGGDPGTVWGLRDLNVHGENDYRIPLTAAKAVETRLTHDATGQPLPATPKKCCHDDWPTSGTVTVVDC